MLQSALSKRLGLHLETLLENNSKVFYTGDFCIVVSACARFYSNQLFLNFRYFTWTNNELHFRPFSPYCTGIFGWNFSEYDFQNLVKKSYDLWSFKIGKNDISKYRENYVTVQKLLSSPKKYYTTKVLFLCRSDVSLRNLLKNLDDQSELFVFRSVKIAIKNLQVYQ